MGSLAPSLLVAFVMAVTVALAGTLWRGERLVRWLPDSAGLRFAVGALASFAPFLLVMELAVAIAGGATVFGRALGGAIAVYFVVWWTVLFAILPIGVRSQLEVGDTVAGSDPGAPSQPLLKKKAILTTAAATLVFAAVWILIIRNALGIDAFDFIPR